LKAIDEVTVRQFLNQRDRKKLDSRGPA